MVITLIPRVLKIAILLPGTSEELCCRKLGRKPGIRPRHVLDARPLLARVRFMRGTQIVSGLSASAIVDHAVGFHDGYTPHPLQEHRVSTSLEMVDVDIDRRFQRTGLASTQDAAATANIRISNFS